MDHTLVCFLLFLFPLLILVVITWLSDGQSLLDAKQRLNAKLAVVEAIDGIGGGSGGGSCGGCIGAGAAFDDGCALRMWMKSICLCWRIAWWLRTGQRVE